MDSPCYQLLARASFSLNQDGGVGRGDALDPVQYRFQGAALSDDLLKLAFAEVLFCEFEGGRSCHEAPSWVSGDRLTASDLQSRLNTFKQRTVAEWLREEFNCTCAQGLHSHLRIAVGRDENGWNSAAVCV